MKLQVALDYFCLEDALALMERIHPYVDIVELGSPLVYAEGFRAIRELRRCYPDKLLLADLKIVDAGYAIASKSFDAGADIVTAIGMTNDATLAGLVCAARERGKAAMVDTIGISALAQRTRELDGMGFDYVLVHTAHDLRDCIGAPLEALRVIKENCSRAQAGISGGIRLDTLPEICAAKPDWVVVGSGLMEASDPAETARQMQLLLHAG